MNKFFSSKIVWVAIIAAVIIIGVFAWRGIAKNSSASLYRSTDLASLQKSPDTNTTSARSLAGILAPFINKGETPYTGCPNKPGGTPWVQVLSPNGGETFTTGQLITVTWKSCKVPAGIDVQITLLNQTNPLTYVNHTLVTQTANDGSEVINLSAQPGMPAFQLGMNFKIQLSYVVTNNYMGPYDANGQVPGLGNGDTSDNLFSVVNTNITTNSVLNSTSIMNVGPGSNDDTGEFVIKFNVTAVNGDVYVPRTFAKAVGDGAQVVHNNSTVFQGLTYNFSTSTTGLTITPNNNYLIPEGTTGTFWVTGIVSLPAAGTAGTYMMEVSSVKWSPVDSVNPTQIKVFNPTYQTNYLFLN